MRESTFRVLAGLGIAVLAIAGPAAAQQRDYRIAVVNQGPVAIEFFYYSACSAPNWGPDRLGSNEVINVGQQKVFNMDDGSTNCCRDMRVKFANKVERERRQVDVCREENWVVR